MRPFGLSIAFAGYYDEMTETFVNIKEKREVVDKDGSHPSERSAWLANGPDHTLKHMVSFCFSAILMPQPEELLEVSSTGLLNPGSGLLDP